MTTNLPAADIRMREAFRTRASQAIEQIAQSASLEDLAQALSASTDFGAVARALGSASLPAAAQNLDPLADAFARGVASREYLIREAGGLLSAAEVGRALGISRQAVDKRRRANQLLAIRVAADWRYPAAQISAEGRTPPHLPAILETGAALGLSPWAMLDFLLAPDTALGGSTPLACLQAQNPDAAPILGILEASKADAFG